METAKSIGTVMGTIIGVVLLAAMLTGIPATYYALRGKPMTKPQVLSVFIVACILAILPQIILKSGR